MKIMLSIFKQIILSTTFNFTLIVFLLVGIQNSSNKSKVTLFAKETINLPISFIVGTSFVCGSFLGSIMQIIWYYHKDDEN